MSVAGDGEVHAFWPADRRFPEEELVHETCAGCGLHWHIHVDLSAGRLQCRCGTWVEVPSRPGDQVAGLLASGISPQHAPLIVAREPTPTPRAIVRPTTTGSDGALRHASVHAQQRWTDRTLLELFFLMLAFLGPQLLIHVGASGDHRAVLQPLGSLVSSVLVFVIAFSSRSLAFQAFRWTRLRYFAEAFLATGAWLGFAYAWLALVKASMPGLDYEDPFKPLADEVGIAMVIFMVGVVPGIFEELAFRGLVQGRLDVLFGRKESILLTGAAFALAHGITLAFPVHMGIGIYLCWLRTRSGSLLPGMLLHFSYNTSLVLGSVS